jgi:DNA helicase-2/ATP-dependent DNA helicase PcrA
MNLDPQQKTAVETRSPRALVLAGAGSGKTRVLTERVAWLMETQKISPYEILAITFTRRAAQELRERIKGRVGPKAHHITMGTIHASGLQLLKRFGDLIGLRPKHLTIYGEWEEAYLLREVATDLGILKGKTWKIPKKQINQTFADYYQDGIPPSLVNILNFVEDDPTHTIFEEVIRRCKENNALTYGAILTGLRLLLPQIKQYLRFKHILIDEIQDVDKLQWIIINLLTEMCGASLFVVGDIDQSIYAWRGAVPEYLVARQEHFELYRIENNYRSTPEIVEAANHVIKNNERRIPRTMRATREDRSKGWTIQRDMDSTELSKFIMTVHGVAYKDVAVLGRNHFLLDRLSEELTALEIPHTKIGRTSRFIESANFRKFHSFLKLLINPFDNFSFLLIRDLLGVSRQEYNEIRLKATQEAKSHFQIWSEHMPERFQNFFHVPDQLKTPGMLAFSLKYMATGALPYGDPPWPFDVEECFLFMMRWVANNSNGTLEQYLDYLATWDLQEEIQQDDKLKLMTLHAAKGLEFPLVILAGCNEGILPSKQSIEREDIEEERRLFYVGMTRAQDSLVVAVRPETKEAVNGRVYENPVSRFIREMQS